jgi:integrase
MAVRSYEENGKILWGVYVNIRSRENRNVRIQRRQTGFKTQDAALEVERQILDDGYRKIARLERQGAKWENVVKRWELSKRENQIDPLAKTTVLDYANCLHNWTRCWNGRVASDLNRGDGREVLKDALDAGKSHEFVRRLKNIINQVYTWGIEERLIAGVHQSPVHGLEIAKKKEEKLPEIWTRNEIQTFLFQAKEQSHDWYPVWAVALLTGLRSGELHALLWENIEMISEQEAQRQDQLPADKRRYGLIRVVQNYNGRTRSVGPTKGGYWRTVPISGDLYWFLLELKKESGGRTHVLPRFWQWDRGQQAQIIRRFCADIRIKSVKFHTLRACFATQLIADGVAPTRVMKIGGWKDFKTLQRYIRMAGIDEQGATEGLKFLPNDEAIMGRVVNLFNFKGPLK